MKYIKIIICLLIVFVFIGCGKEYEVKFLGFDDAELNTVIVKEKDKLVYPEAPVVEGYTFTGWDKNLEYVSDNTVIKALYEVITFTVKFYDKDNNLVETKTVNYGEDVTPSENYEVEGYNLVGWDKELTSVKSDFDVKPVYEIKTFNVSFYNNLNELIETKVVEYGKSVSLDAPSLTGHTFVNWDKDLSSIKTDLEVYPEYSKNEYTVTFKDSDDVLIEEQTVLYGEKAADVSAPAIEGYTFVEWDKDISFISENITVKPVYKINKYVEKL